MKIKKLFGLLMIVLIASMGFTSCTGVDAGHKGVEVSWGGKTNLEVVHDEGMNWGFHWLWDDMVKYDVRERTVVEKFEFNDKNNMLTGVEIALDFNLNPKKVNILHVEIEDYEVKILKTLKSAGKEVVPQYSASELNLIKRQEAEQLLSDVLSKELPEFYVEFARVQITDVDIPVKIAEAAEATAKQMELNKLALEKATEAQNNFKAAEWDAQTQEILSKPAMLKLKELAIQEKMWDGYLKHGTSPYGNNNVFGAETAIFKGMK